MNVFSRSILLCTAALFVVAACAPVATSTPASTPTTAAVSTATTKPQPTEISTEAATNTPEPTQTQTPPAWFTLDDTYKNAPTFITELKINGGAPIAAKLTADPSLWEVIKSDNGIGKEIKTTGKTECTLHLYGSEGLPYDDPSYDHVDLGKGLVYADTNETNNGIHYVNYILSKYSGKNSDFDGLFFEATSPAGKWDACRPLVRAVIGSLEPAE